MIPLPELVVVRWVDAYFDLDLAEVVVRDYVVTTAGFLAGETERVVSVASEILPDGDGFRAVTHIPRAMIRRIDRVRVPPALEEVG